jgi:hypothetical protein
MLTRRSTSDSSTSSAEGIVAWRWRIDHGDGFFGLWHYTDHRPDLDDVEIEALAVVDDDRSS